MVLLSHFLGPDSPVYPGLPAVRIEPRKQMEKGDVCNSFDLSFCNHSGTHLDAPAHFNPEGPKVGDLPLECFVFEKPLLLDIPKGERELVEREELEAFRDKLEGADALLLRTGFGKLREEKPRVYRCRNVALSVGAAEFVVEELRSVRAVFIDSISIGPAWDPEVSVKVHRALCGWGREDGRFVLIVEDVNLSLAPRKMRRVWALPLPLKVADSAPCVVVAE